jgi:hypothetical protein
MVQVVEHLPSKSKALSSKPSISKGKIKLKKKVCETEDPD